MGLDRRLIELTRGTRRWIAATVALGWLIVALNVAQTVLIGRAIGDALAGQSGMGWLLVAFVGLVPVRAALNWAAPSSSKYHELGSVRGSPGLFFDNRIELLVDL